MKEYKPNGICAKKICFDIVDGNLTGIKFEGGCDGNLKAIAKLLEGKNALEAVKLLKGNHCQNRGTSCVDQLARAIEGCL